MKTTKSLAWCIIVCIMLSITAPIIAYANTGTTVITYNGTEIIPEITPYESPLGLMANAEDMAKVFSLEYDSNPVAKYFKMVSELHGDIYLVHNATKFSSGDNEFDCAPNFYFENGIPMVEVGFFCELFNAEYSISSSEIVIKDKVEEVSEEAEEESITSENFPTFEEIKLHEPANLEAVSGGKISGTIKFDKNVAAPSTGLDVTLNLVAYSTRYTSYGASIYYYGYSEQIGTVNFNSGEKSKSYSFNVPDTRYYNYYPNYIIYYTTTTRNCIYSPAFLRNDGKCEIHYSSFSSYPTGAKIFQFGNSYNADIELITYASYGNKPSGKAGDNITWVFDEYSGELTLTGRGSMYSYLYYQAWRDYRDRVKSITIGEGITDIGTRAFSFMSSLETVSIPNSVKVIGTEAFGDCSSLRSVELPKHLTKIESWAFEYCNSLTTITIPDSINPDAMGRNVFNYCSSLGAIYAPYKLAANESTWKGSCPAQIFYDCNVVYKVNGRTVSAEDIAPGAVINVPPTDTVPEGGEYYLMVNGKNYSGSTITINGNTVIDQVYISPAEDVKSVMECSEFQRSTYGEYNFSFDIKTIADTSAQPTTLVVAIYDSIGNLVGIKRIAYEGDPVSGTITGENAESYKIMAMDYNTLKPSAFSCEGSFNN